MDHQPLTVVGPAVSGFILGFVASVAASYLWTLYHVRKREKIREQISAARYYSDYQNREANKQD